MIGALGLAVVLLQSIVPVNTQAAAQVAFLSTDGPVSVSAIPATPRNRTVRVLILSFSSNSLVIAGERAGLRIKEASPRFQITLPAGVEADDVLLLRMKSKDGRRGVGHSSSLEHPFSKDDLMPVKIEPAVAGLEPAGPATPRVYRVVTTAPLKPGEYALLIDMRFFDFGVN
jgi:hypothetical protein